MISANMEKKLKISLAIKKNGYIYLSLIGHAR